MLENINGKEILDGVRGVEALDREPIARLIVAVSDLVLRHPNIEELDLNPILYGSDGIKIVDWLAMGTLLLDGA